MITHTVGSDLYSVQIYADDLCFSEFNATTEFEKWATMEVSNFNVIPKGMDAMIIPEGKYAVFIHKGSAAEFHKTFQYIFYTWLPSSGYQVDSRPHFEVLGDLYDNQSPNSQEEVWIPIRKSSANP